MMLMIIVYISLWFCIHYPIAGGRVQEDSYSAASFNRRCNPEEAQGRTSSWMGMVPSRLISTGTQWSLRLESSILLSPFFAPQINYTCSGLRCWAHWRGRWCGAQTVPASPSSRLRNLKSHFMIYDLRSTPERYLFLGSHDITRYFRFWYDNHTILAIFTIW